MWPKLVDLSRDESNRILRSLELEAYCNIVTAFRAQGDLTPDKKKVLTDLQHYLSISTERHRAEVRRAVNDERLTTIADHISGPNVSSEWLVEGRRLVPLMPRLVPQTAFTVTANTMSSMQVEKNSSMPSPCATGNKDISVPALSSTPKLTRPSSPTSNVVVLPSGMSIHIKGGLNTDEDEEMISRKRQRSTSLDSLVTRTITTVTVPGSKTSMAGSGSLHGVSPMKITIPKSTGVARVQGSNHKVILVSSSGGGQPSILQKSIPVVKSSAVPHKASVIISGSSSPKSVATATTAFLANTLTMSRPRPKTITTRPRMNSPRSSVSSSGGSPVYPSPQTIMGLSSKQGSKSSIQIKQEGTVKIITQAAGGKIIPRNQSPVVIVTSGSSSSMSRSHTFSGQQKVLSITTQGGRVIATPSGSRVSSNIVTVNPKTLQISTKGQGLHLPETKPNVIVVQKSNQALAKRLSTPSTPPTSRSFSSLSNVTSPFEKEGTGGGSISTIKVQTIEKKLPPKQQTQDQMKVDETTTSGKSSLLAELIQAAGILPDTDSGPNSRGATPVLDEGEPTEFSRVTLPGNQWVEFDAPEGQEDVSAIKALLEMKSGNSLEQEFQQPHKNEPNQLSEEDVLSSTEGLPFNIKKEIQVKQEQIFINPDDLQGIIPVISSSSLDPQTGLFYQQQRIRTHQQTESANIPPPQSKIHVDSQSNVVYTSTCSEPQLVPSDVQLTEGPTPTGDDTSDKTIDIFSSALAQANIDLDPYQFIDDDEETFTTGSRSYLAQSGMHAQKHSGSVVSVLNTDSTVSVSYPQSSTAIVSSTVTSLETSLFGDAVKSETKLSLESSSLVPDQETNSSTLNVMQQSESTAPLDSSVTDEELLDQQSESAFVHQSSEETFTDSQGSKRKRKVSAASGSSSVVGGWNRAALNLLQKMSKFRGLNRDKGEISASAWFLFPVDEKDAPGYLSVIKQPMDFSTVRKKLETGQYNNFSDFHTDMHLIRDNCYLYNPEGHDARKDCGEVFSFYEQEYAKLIEKWNKTHTLSPSSKKLKVDKSPVYL